ncbi:hypothetical protein HZS_7930 [Henneguya salminicola]|nr:hypothetical protein HZS_7930 [Henneguya salminicola]
MHLLIVYFSILFANINILIFSKDRKNKANTCPDYCSNICKPDCKKKCCDIIEKFRQLQRLNFNSFEKRNDIISWSMVQNNPVSQLLHNPKRMSIACEDEKIYLGCEREREKIVISEAFYGRNESAYKCLEHKNMNKNLCISKTRNAQSHKILNSLCTGETYCELIVRKSTITPGDKEPHCQGTSKYLKVSYQCIKIV